MQFLCDYFGAEQPGTKQAASLQQALAWELGLKSNQRVIGYSFDSQATVAPMGIFFQVGCSYSFQSSQLGEVSNSCPAIK